MAAPRLRPARILSLHKTAALAAGFLCKDRILAGWGNELPVRVAA